MLIEKASHKGTISIWFYSYEILRLGKSREEKITSGHQGEQVRVQALEDDSWEVQFLLGEWWRCSKINCGAGWTTLWIYQKTVNFAL